MAPDRQDGPNATQALIDLALAHPEKEKIMVARAGAAWRTSAELRQQLKENRNPEEETTSSTSRPTTPTRVPLSMCGRKPKTPPPTPARHPRRHPQRTQDLHPNTHHPPPPHKMTLF